MRVHIIPFFSPLAQSKWKTSVVNQLAESGAQIITPEDFLNKELKRNRTVLDQHNYIFVGTGGTENFIAPFLSKTKLRPPIILLSYDRNNSLPAAMETRAYLHQNHFTSRIIHATLPQLIERIREWCEFAEIETNIRNSRIGIVGKPSSWLIASSVNPSAVQQRWGVTIEEYPLTKIVDNLKDKLSEEYKVTLDQFIGRAACSDIPEDEIRKAGLVTQALLEFVRKNNLDAMTLECFTLLEKINITGCHALSHLNDLAGFTAGCEGDVPTTFTMMLAKLLTQRPVFMANVVDVDIDAHSVVFAHCTVPTTILEGYEITTHFESGKSMAIRGKFNPQEITVLKVFGEDLSDFWISRGVITENLTNEQGCRTQIRVRLTESVSYFLEESLANHHVVIPGDHYRKLQEFFSFTFRQ
ncbi:MAG: hypothetical protein ACE5R6_13665 [Candidatus Heimdallarchaeota archaeon]